MSIRKQYKKMLCLLALNIIATCLWINGRMSMPVVTTFKTESKTAVSIFMYHSLLKDKRRAGDYVVSPEQFENDIRYLRDSGYHFITMTDLIRFVNGKFTKLPDKPVIITFDDGSYNNYLYAYPIMQKYDAPFVISIIGKYTELNKEDEKMNAYYSHLTWGQIKEMHDSKLVDIQNHSYDLHTISWKRAGSTKNTDESLEEYKTILEEDLMKLQKLLKKNTRVEPNTFTYPFGRISTESVDILKDLGFDAALTCGSGINYIGKEDREMLFHLKRYNRPNGPSSERYFRGKLAE